MQFGTDAFAAANQFGNAFTGASQGQVQADISGGISSGSTSLVFEMPGLTDLTGTNQPTLQIGVVNAAPLMPAGNPAIYHGTSDLDWWYTPNASELDGNGVPTNQVLGAITASTLTAGPGRITFAPDPLVPYLTGRLDMSSAVIKATVGSSSAPLQSTNAYPPGHLPSENLDPLLMSFASMSAGQLKGNITAASLASTPIPASLLGTATVEGYTLANTMLDLVVHGAHSSLFGTTLVKATEPDQADADAPMAGAARTLQIDRQCSPYGDGMQGQE